VIGSAAHAQGLFRTAQQKKPAEFLGRAFTSEADRAAAAKNAFVLLAQHKPQMAAAFFILGARPAAARLHARSASSSVHPLGRSQYGPLLDSHLYVSACLHGASSQLGACDNAPALACAAGHLRDAVGVCARELGDPQLALLLARLLEPSPGPLLHHTLAEELLPREPPLPPLASGCIVQGLNLPGAGDLL
jgi:hypothetical protein